MASREWTKTAIATMELLTDSDKLLRMGFAPSSEAIEENDPGYLDEMSLAKSAFELACHQVRDEIAEGRVFSEVVHVNNCRSA